jgi:hypothetical protein
MCKELFPSSDFNMYDLVNVGEGKVYPEIWIIQDNSQIFPPYIHWFAFLMCELIPKFKKLGINIDYWLMTLPSTHIQWSGTNVNHPIDYIYNKFKELKNESN